MSDIENGSTFNRVPPALEKIVESFLVVCLLLLVGCASAPRAPAPAPQPAQEKSPAQAAQPAATAPATAPAAAPEAAPAEPAPAAQPPTAAEEQQAARPSSISAEALGLYRTPEEQQQPPSDDELAVIASAKTLLGKPPNAKVVVNGKQFVLDCIGTVSAIYYRLWLDVTRDFALYSGNGVNRLYMTLSEKNVLHTDRYPRPGDVIVWNNTWDANANGNRTDDLKTHAGIVLAVDEDGTIHYVHENLYKGVMIEMMNLLQPVTARDESGKVLNSGLAIATKSGGPKPEHWLSGDVFNTFGDVLAIKDYFLVEHAEAEEGISLEAAEMALKVER